MTDRKYYSHADMFEAEKIYETTLLFEKDIEKVYDEIDYRKIQPDLLGKTVELSKRQFPKIYEMIQRLFVNENIEMPPIFLYEDFYYGVESKGTNKPWIEISAKTVQDLSEHEIKFLISREVANIKDGVTRRKTIMEQFLKMVASGSYIPGVKTYDKSIKASLMHWYRLANYSADNYAYFICGSLDDSIGAILKLILNSVVLAENTDVRAYMGQTAKINEMSDMISNFTKADEAVPYGPFRIKNLMAFAIKNMDSMVEI